MKCDYQLSSAATHPAMKSKWVHLRGSHLDFLRYKFTNIVLRIPFLELPFLNVSLNGSLDRVR